LSLLSIDDYVPGARLFQWPFGDRDYPTLAPSASLGAEGLALLA
jgi:hypothetical protein